MSWEESAPWREPVIRPRFLSSELIDVGSRSGPWGWRSSKPLKWSSKSRMCGHRVVRIVSGGGVRKGCGKFLWLSLNPWRLSAPSWESAPSESRRLAWQLPVVSHRLNGGTKQMLHFLFRRQPYWTGSFNLKTQLCCFNLWKTCQVRKITFIRNQLILCIFQFRKGLKEQDGSALGNIKIQIFFSLFVC